LVAVLCCALPLLLFSGLLITGGGLVISQQFLVGLGILIIALGGLSFLVMKVRSRSQ